MTDRNVQYPYRFHVKPVPGTDDICEIIPAPGTVYEDGTFWNKANVLQDVTAALYGLTASVVPDEVFAAIRPMIQATQTEADKKPDIVTGSYVGTAGVYTQKPIVLTFTFPPKFIYVMTNLSKLNGANYASILGEGGQVFMFFSSSNKVSALSVTISNDGKTFTAEATYKMNNGKCNYIAIG